MNELCARPNKTTNSTLNSSDQACASLVKPAQELATHPCAEEGGQGASSSAGHRWLHRWQEGCRNRLGPGWQPITPTALHPRRRARGPKNPAALAVGSAGMPCDSFPTAYDSSLLAAFLATRAAARSISPHPAQAKPKQSEPSTSGS